MILNSQYSSPVIPTPSPNERLVEGTTQANTILRGSVVDGVEASNSSSKQRTVKVGDDDQQQQRQSSTLTQAQYEKVAQAHQQTIYDKPQGAQRLAISHYQSVQYAPKREEIQRLVGIDTFA